VFPKPKRTKDRKLLDSYFDRVCVACNSKGAEAHHVRSKAANGPDESWNLMALCRQDHTHIHKMGLDSFASKNIGVKRWLLANGWYFCEVRSKWVNDLNNAEK
jgi:5-methylcytosine-specific restriction endonuclease McrA